MTRPLPPQSESGRLRAEGRDQVARSARLIARSRELLGRYRELVRQYREKRAGVPAVLCPRCWHVVPAGATGAGAVVTCLSCQARVRVPGA